jgi:hypothetical protein
METGMNAARLFATAAVLALMAGCEEQGSSGGSGAAADGAGTGGSTFTLRPKSLVGKVDMSGIAQAVRAFEVNMGRLPTSAEGLGVLVSSDGLERDQDKWQGPYVPSLDDMVDTYGTPIEYENTGGGFVLRSLGADGVRGGSGSSADVELRF